MPQTYTLTEIVGAIDEIDGEALRSFEQKLVLARKLAKVRVVQAEGSVKQREAARYSVESAALLTILFGLIELNPSLSRIDALLDPEPVGSDSGGNPVFSPIKPELQNVISSIKANDWLLEVVAFVPADTPRDKGAIKFYGGYRTEGEVSPYVPGLLEASHELKGERFLWIATLPISSRVRSVLLLLGGDEP